MARTRKQGGTVRRLRSGRWQALVDTDGKRVSIGGTFGTSQDPLDGVRRAVVESDRGTFQPTRSAPVFEQFARCEVRLRTSARGPARATSPSWSPCCSPTRPAAERALSLTDIGDRVEVTFDDGERKSASGVVTNVNYFGLVLDERRVIPTKTILGMSILEPGTQPAARTDNARHKKEASAAMSMLLTRHSRGLSPLASPQLFAWLQNVQHVPHEDARPLANWVLSKFRPGHGDPLDLLS